MSIQIIDVSACRKNVVVTVPAQELEGTIQELALKYAIRVKVPGFRPGKVPLTIVKQRFASELRTEATQDLIGRHWEAAMKEHDLHPLTEPRVENIDSEPGHPLQFTLSFEVLPPIEVRDYLGVPVILEHAAVSEEDVTRVLENLREQTAQLAPVENAPIRDGHVANLSIDGEFDDGGKPVHEDDVVCVVGNSKTNETFSENLRGRTTGEVVAFDVAYPSDYHRKRFAGRTVHYRVTVRDVKEKQLADLNDEFAKDVAGQENIEALRSRIRDDLVTNARQAAEKKAREVMLDQVVGRHSFEIPESLVREELEDHARRIVGRLAGQGIDVKQTSIDWRKVFEEERPNAEKAVRRALVLDAIGRQEDIGITEQDIAEEFVKLSEVSGKSAVALRAEFEKSQRIQGFKDHLRRKKALDFVYRNATISRG